MKKSLDQWFARIRVFVVVFAAFSGFSFHAQAEEKPATFRIVAYNIHHGAGVDKKLDLERIGKLLAQQKLGYRSDAGRADGHASKLRKVHGFPGGEYGLAVLSRFPILKSVKHQLPEGSESRCAQEVQVEVPGMEGVLSFVSVHNDWKDEVIRVSQVKALLAGLKEREHPVILAGDFNGERSDRSMQLLE